MKSIPGTCAGGGARHQRRNRSNAYLGKVDRCSARRDRLYGRVEYIDRWGEDGDVIENGGANGDSFAPDEKEQVDEDDWAS
jgi:hypothetical protein